MDALARLVARKPAEAKEALASIVEGIVLTPGPDGYKAKLTLMTEQAAPRDGLFVQSGCGGARWSKADLLAFAPSLRPAREP